MFRIIYLMLLSFIFMTPAVTGQQVFYSDYNREDNRDINFEIIGKLNSNILVYKNINWRHKISVYDKEMKTIETVQLDFVPDKTFNVDFIAYPDFFYMIYQFQKRSILYCMAVKMDANGKQMGEPVGLDTTQIPLWSSNKIYSTIYSEDRQKIMVFKIQKKWEKFNMVTMLFNKDMKMINKTRQTLPYDDRRDNYGDFVLDNDGHFAFTMDKQAGYRESSNMLTLVTLSPASDTLAYYNINLDNKYVEEVNLKVDNLNNRYIINSFYYLKSRGSIEGLFTCSWDKVKAIQSPSAFNVFDPSFRSEAKSDGQQRYAFDDFFIREVYIKKDGGFVITAEDFSTQTRGFNNNSWNRYDYLNNYSSNTSGSYYYYDPYRGYYRPYNSYNNQSTRYFYANIIVLSVDKNGIAQWGKVIHKDQFEDNDENFLSYASMNSGGEIHFLFNIDRKNEVISDQSIDADGEIRRNATLKSRERGYEFLAKSSKQTGARQLIIPCLYRTYICFAKVDF